jgi:hypothetical protein
MSRGSGRWAQSARWCEVPLQQRRQADGLVAEELRANHRVDQIHRREAEVAVEDAQVVVGAVQDLGDAAVRQHRAEAGEVEPPQRVDDEVLPRH